MPISILSLGMTVFSAYTALVLSTMQPVAATPPVAQAQAREWRYETDARSISQSLNTWAASGVAFQTPLGTAQLQQLSAEIGNNALIVRGTASTGWFSVPVDAQASVSVDAGNVQVHVVGAHINGMDVPEVARGQLEQQLQTQLVQAVAGSGVVVRSVELRDGKLEVTWVG
jgi:hypothetical protein